MFEDFHPAYITVEEYGDVTAVRFNLTHLTDEENIEQIGRELFAVIEQFERRKVVLDLKDVQFATSSALGKMITLHRKLHRNEGKLVLCNIGGEIGEVLRTSRLVDYFNIAEDTDAAIRDLSRSRSA